ncbi:Cuticle protein 8 [Anthophora retusa]
MKKRHFRVRINRAESIAIVVKLSGIHFALILSVVAIAAVRHTYATHAHSFAHYHGPVEGPAKEVSLHGKHGHHHIGYVAYPKYEFSYGVDDHHTGDHHGQKEHRDGKNVVGEYTVKEPGGNIRTVKYHADPHAGFFAYVHNSNGNDHEGGTYAGHGQSEGYSGYY